MCKGRLRLLAAAPLLQGLYRLASAQRHSFYSRLSEETDSSNFLAAKSASFVHTGNRIDEMRLLDNTQFRKLPQNR